MSNSETTNLAEALTNERYKLEAIIEHSPAAMVLWQGPNHVFEKVNPQFQAIFPGRKLLGKPFLEALPEFVGQSFNDLLDKVFETGETFLGHEVLARHPRVPGGPLEDFYYDFTYERIVDMNGRPYGVLDHAIDVTERVKSRRALEETVKELERERELRNQFVATLTHDLRNPLTVAKMNAQIMNKKASDIDAVHLSATRIVDALNRADTMIRDLLDASRIRAGELLPLKFEPSQLNLIVAETVEDLSSVHGDRFKIEANSKIEGNWNQESIKRILENLCNNAIKYGDAHSPITVFLSEEKDFALIKVHNYGQHIPPLELRELFTPFKRTEKAEKGVQKGWGLGLTLVKGLSESHGGSVAVESEEGKGTTFCVRLKKICD